MNNDNSTQDVPQSEGLSEASALDGANASMPENLENLASPQESSAASAAFETPVSSEALAASTPEASATPATSALAFPEMSAAPEIAAALSETPTNTEKADGQFSLSDSQPLTTGIPSVPEPLQKSAEKVKALGILATVFGGLGLLFSWIAIVGIFFAFVGLVLGIIGLILNAKNKKALVLIGTIISAVALILSILFTVIEFAYIRNNNSSSTANLNSVPSISLPSSSQPSSSAKSSSSSSSSSSEDNNDMSTTGPAFSWTFNDFTQLVVGDYDTGQGGANYTAVIQKYGQPQQSQDDSTSGTLTREITYQVSDDNDFNDQREVDLTFTQQSDGSFLLSEAGESQLGAKNTDIAGLTCPFSLSDYTALAVGDSMTGQGGANISSIFSKFNYPNSIDITNEQNTLSADVTYQNTDSSKKVDLTFIQQSNGDNLLSQKQQQGLN